MSTINKNTENFIIKCKEKFGIEYDYSNINYKNIKNPITIKHNVCQTVFTIYPQNFLKSNLPCPFCRKRSIKPKTNKYKDFENEKIYQITINTINNKTVYDIIREFNSIDEIIYSTGINKNKKSNIKRCCYMNHEKIINKQIFNKLLNFSKCVEIIWIYESDYKLLKND